MENLLFKWMFQVDQEFFKIEVKQRDLTKIEIKIGRYIQMALFLIQVIGVIFLLVICAGAVLMYEFLRALPTESSRTIDPDPTLTTNTHSLKKTV